MPLRATVRSKLPATRDALSKTVAREMPLPARAIPLALAPLLQPYRKHGRLSLRVEHMLQLARLSRGRNNGDGSWSLATDELDDLEYLAPEGGGEAQSLSIRVIGLDQEASTLAILDVPLTPGSAQPRAAQADVAASANMREHDALLQRQRDELKDLKIELAAREAELALHRAAAEQSEAALEQGKNAWLAEQNSLIAKSEKHTEERLAEAQERWRRETKEAAAVAETAWKAAEAARSAKAQSEWREKSASALSEMTARCERAEAALVRAEARAAAKPARDEGESRLLGELAALRATLADRDAALAQARKATEQAKERSQRDSETALSNAKAGWKTEETARFAAAEAQWRKQSASAQAALTARCERAEAALSDAEARAAAKPVRDEGEVRRLRDEMEALRASLADRSALLAQSRAAAEQIRASARQESEAALSAAKADWKKEETARFAAADAQWRQQLESTQAELTSRCERAEAALSDTGAEAAAKTARGEAELRSVREELATLRTALSDRDTVLVQVRKAAEQMQERSRQESQAALSNAMAGWKSEEVARLAAAEAQWRKQSAVALAEATARYKEAETALAQIRVRARDHSDSDVIGRLRAEVASLQSTLADREGEAPLTKMASREMSSLQPRISLRENHDWNGDDPSASRLQSKSPRRLIRDIVVVALLAASAIVFWPRIESFMPESWQRSIAAFTTSSGSTVAAPPVQTASQTPAAATAAAPQTAMVVHAANMRADPAKTAAIVLTLQHGADVAIVNRRNNWTLVRTDGKNGKAQQGWVYSTNLKADADKTSSAAKPRKDKP
ncbi:MAG: SH3 domain-containing protein [Rhizomicrobium sp.]